MILSKNIKITTDSYWKEPWSGESLRSSRSCTLLYLLSLQPPLPPAHVSGQLATSATFNTNTTWPDGLSKLIKENKMFMSLLSLSVWCIYGIGKNALFYFFYILFLSYSRHKHFPPSCKWYLIWKQQGWFLLSYLYTFS